MHRSYSGFGAAAIAGLLAIFLAECTGGPSGNPPDPTLPPVTTVVATTIETEPTTTSRPSTSVAAATTSVVSTTGVPVTTTPPTSAATTTTSSAATTQPPINPSVTHTPPPTAAPTTERPSTTPPPATTPPATAVPTTAAPITTPQPPSTPAPTAPPTAPPTSQTPSANPGASPSPDAVALTNQQRQAAGLPALTATGPLTAAAAQHSADQAGRNSMGHTGSDGSSAGDRIRANGGSFNTWAENVAAGYGSATGVVDGWMNSPGHRQNILNPSMTQIGVAVAIAADGTPYWTMVLSG